ncbi:MAG: hypothetical protein DHS20C01_10030 [marine bacterium B5-7]|nr:MAG: hypothetical protein DHS20C01_10030 [marine bacterium B5-7]
MNHDGLGPDALELLTLARRTLLDEVAIKLDGAARYQLLLVAHALAVAGRELEGRQNTDNTGADESLSMSINKLLDDPLTAAKARDDKTGATPLKWLCSEIRNGRFDNLKSQHGLLALLRSINRSTLELTNPRFLEGGS